MKARPIPFARRPKVEKELEKLERDGIISKIEMSDWASPIVPVLNKDGSVRICGDFKVTVNQVLQVDQYPLPRIDDIFATLAGGRKFTKLDIRQAYLQMPLGDDSKKLQAINTHKGLYEYNRLTFGIASAPSIWQRAMDQILQGLSGVQCVLDDMIITGKSDDEHLQNLENVLKKLQDSGLRANIEKCSFLQDSVVYCGHEISKEGLHKTKDKVEAVVNTPAPKNTTQLRALLGLVNYYHKFLLNLATEIRPLNELLEKDRKWVWNERCNRAFLKVKDIITSYVVHIMILIYQYD
jgi:hypothetical protein